MKVKLERPDRRARVPLLAPHQGPGEQPGGQAASEITALTNGTFIVDERDGKFEGTSNGTATGTAKSDKNLWKIDLSSATDVGPSSPLIGTTIAGGAVTWDSSGLNVGGKSIEDIAGTSSDAAAIAALSTAGITTGGESLYLNYAALVTAIDPTGMYFGHDKVEGVAIDPAEPEHRSTSPTTRTSASPTCRHGPNPTANKRAKGYDAKKFLPDHTTQDFGEILMVDLSQVPSAYKSGS